MTETLWGVIIGGFITLVVSVSTQLMAITHEKKSSQREELRPLASRALRAAQQAWQTRAMYAIWENRHEEMASNELVDKMSESYEQWEEAFSEFQLAMEELSLLIPSVERENERLSDALILGRLKPGPRASLADEQTEYSAARKALQEKLRRLLRTA